MEDQKACVSELSQLDFDEWINIPKPLIQALVVFKSCFADQAKKISDYESELEKLNSKIGIKLRAFNEALATTNESIRGQQETILKKVRERCEFVSNDYQLFKKTFSEDNANRQRVAGEAISEMMEKVKNCEKAVMKIVTINEVQTIVNEKEFMLHQSITNQVRDHQIRPIVDKLMSEIRSATE